jgi:hypothetical protein
MLFHITTFNHGRQGQIIVEDITMTMANQLIALGHQARCTTEPDFIPAEAGWNVVLESFADDAVIVPFSIVPKIAEAHASGCRFICVATEEPGENGFNSALDPGMIRRQAAFPEAMRFFDAILHLVPGDRVTRWYSQFAPAAYAETGFAPASVLSDDVEPDHSFGFYGKMTWRRDQIIKTLEAVTGEKVLQLTGLDTLMAERDAFMRRAKVILQVRANLEWQWVSATRCASALHFGRPVAAEAHDIKGPWEDILTFSAPDEKEKGFPASSFYHDVAAMAADWRGAHQAQMARFSAALPPERCVGQPLREVGIIQ